MVISNPSLPLLGPKIWALTGQKARKFASRRPAAGAKILGSVNLYLSGRSRGARGPPLATSDYVLCRFVLCSAFHGAAHATPSLGRAPNPHRGARASLYITSRNVGCVSEILSGTIGISIENYHLHVNFRSDRANLKFYNSGLPFTLTALCPERARIFARGLQSGAGLRPMHSRLLIRSTCHEARGVSASLRGALARFSP